MNKKLAHSNHRSSEAAGYWRVYGRQWTRLNHVRSLGSTITAGLYLVAANNLASAQV